MDKSVTEQELRNVQKRKLDLEIEALSTSRYWYIAFPQKIGRWVVRNSGVFALPIASAGAVFGLIQYHETVQRDFRKPLWGKQLNLYLEGDVVVEVPGGSSVYLSFLPVMKAADFITSIESANPADKTACASIRLASTYLYIGLK